MAAITQEQLDKLSYSVRAKRIRIELLDINLKTIDSIEGVCIDGQITANADNDIRRSGSLTIAIPITVDASSLLEYTGGFAVDYQGKIWLDKYVKLFVGIDDINDENNTTWYKLGVFMIDQPIASYSSDNYTITFDCIDLMAKLTGQRQGQLTGLGISIEKGSDGLAFTDDSSFFATMIKNNDFSKIYYFTVKLKTGEVVDSSLIETSVGQYTYATQDSSYFYIGKSGWVSWDGVVNSAVLYKISKETGKIVSQANIPDSIPYLSVLCVSGSYLYTFGSNYDRETDKSTFFLAQFSIDDLSFIRSTLCWNEVSGGGLRDGYITCDESYVYVYAIEFYNSTSPFLVFDKNSLSSISFNTVGSLDDSIGWGLFPFKKNGDTVLVSVDANSYFYQITISSGTITIEKKGLSKCNSDIYVHQDYLFWFDYDDYLKKVKFDDLNNPQQILRMSYDPFYLSGDEFFLYIIDQSWNGYKKISYDDFSKIESVPLELGVVPNGIFWANQNNSLEQVYIKTKTEDALKSLISELGGITKYSIYPIPEKYEYLPYDIKIGVGSTVYDAIKEILNILSTWQAYFDIDGVLRIEPIPSGEKDIVYPVEFLQLISNDESYDFQNVKNQVVVYGRLNNLTYYTETPPTFTNESRFLSGITNPFSYEIEDMVGDDDYLYLAGFNGTSSNVTSDFGVYNKSSGVFEYFIPSPLGTGGIMKLVSDTDYVYCGGSANNSQGETNNNKFIVYNKSTHSFGNVIPTPFTGEVIGLAQDNKNVYAASATFGAGEFAVYSKATGTFGPLIPLTIMESTQITADDKYVYIGGSTVSTPRKPAMCIYNKETGEVSPAIEVNPSSTGLGGTTGICNDATHVYIGGGGGDGFVAIYDKIQGVVTDVIGSGMDYIGAMTVDDFYVYCGGGLSNSGAFKVLNKTTKTFGDFIPNDFSGGILSVYRDPNTIYVAGGDSSLYWSAGGVLMPFEIIGKLSLTFESLDSSSFTISGTSFGFLSAPTYNEEQLNSVLLYSGTTLIGEFPLVGFADEKKYVSPHEIQPSEIYFIRIYDAPLAETGFADLSDPSKVIFEFMGKQQVSETLVTDTEESPFYINRNLPEPNYYAGLSFGVGDDYLLTINNKTPLNAFPDKGIITFMPNYTNKENPTISVNSASGISLLTNVPIVQNKWVTSITPATRKPIDIAKISNDYTIWEVQYDATNNWFVLLGRNPSVITQVFSDGEYDNIYADQLAHERCLYELYQHSNMQNSITIGTVPNYLLDVNCKIPYRENTALPTDWDNPNPEISYYITKQITYPLGLDATPQSITAIKIYDDGNLLGDNY